MKAEEPPFFPQRGVGGLFLTARLGPSFIYALYSHSARTHLRALRLLLCPAIGPRVYIFQRGQIEQSGRCQ
jgi:hypothetical protein